MFILAAFGSLALLLLLSFLSLLLFVCLFVCTTLVKFISTYFMCSFVCKHARVLLCSAFYYMPYTKKKIIVIITCAFFSHPIFLYYIYKILTCPQYILFQFGNTLNTSVRTLTTDRTNERTHKRVILYSDVIIIIQFISNIIIICGLSYNL